MTALVLDGAAMARDILGELKPRVESLTRRGVVPGLATVLVGDSAASHVYVRSKLKACIEVGLHSELHALDADTTDDAILATISALNRSATIHGTIVQLPLPDRIDARRALQSIAISKDVDGFNWANLGALVDGDLRLAPCTPLGVIAMLDRSGIAIEGRHAVVIGRSSIVGKPLALMLINRGATVTVCNSKTPDLAAATRSADILVSAAGRPRLITGEMVRDGAAVIDVGINRLPDGRIVGDVDYDAVKAKAGAVSPVPGGVGRMTVAMLVANTVLATERSLLRGESTAPA